MRNRVQLFRKAKHWTQTDLAARVGVNRQCIDAIEEGRFLPSIALAYNIADALELYVYEVSHARARLRDQRFRNYAGHQGKKPGLTEDFCSSAGSSKRGPIF